MPTDTEKTKIAHLEQLNSELLDSLGRCRELLSTYESQLAANNNESFIAESDHATRSSRRDS